MSDSTERLIDRLVTELTPVRPIPRIRSAFAVILAVWAALLGVVFMAQSSQLAVDSLARSQIYLASFLGLVVAALGGSASALAAGVPGRERIELGGLVLAWLGLLAAAGACLVGMRAAGAAVSEAAGGMDAMCFSHGVYLSLLPAGVIIGFLVRGWAAHPFRAAAIALFGSGALGVLIVHLSCGFIGPRHVLIGHLSVPIVLMSLGLYPLALILRRIRR